MALEWKHAAVCLEQYPEVDMIDMGQGGHARAKALIAKFCDGCTVQQQCASWALAGSSPVGIWAGVFVPVEAGKRRREALKALVAKSAMLPSSEHAA